MEKLKFNFKCDGNIGTIELSEKSVEEASILGAPILIEQSGQFSVIGVVGWTSEETLCPCYWNKNTLGEFSVVCIYIHLVGRIFSK